MCLFTMGKTLDRGVAMWFDLRGRVLNGGGLAGGTCMTWFARVGRFHPREDIGVRVRGGYKCVM